MAFELNGRTALVTGASEGIGRAIARHLAQAGVARLIVVARRKEKLSSLADEIPDGCGLRVIPMDLAEANAPEALADAVADEDISLLVNNAGVGVLGAFEGQTQAQLDFMLNLNIRFLTAFSHLMLPRLKATAGDACILNVGSVAGHQGVPNMAAYAATKAYVNHFSEGLNLELKGSGVSVLCLEPGQTASAFFDYSQKNDAFVTKMGMSTVDHVAAAAVSQIRRGKGREVVGLLNKLTMISGHFAPRALVGFVLRKMFRDMA